MNFLRINTFRTIRVLVFFPLIFLTGCASKIAYNTLPFWIEFYLTDYVTLTNAQEELLEKDLDQFHQWHRQTQLKKINQLAAKIESDVKKKLTLEQITALDLTLKRTFANSLIGMTPTFTRLFSSLSDAQAEAMLKAINKKIKQIQEEANEGTVAEQKERRLESIEERAEYWLDDITRQQKAIFIALVNQQIAMRPVFYSIRDQYLDEFTVLLNKRQQPDFELKLKQFFEKIIFVKNHQQQKFMQLYRQQQLNGLHQIQNNLSSSQAKAFKERLLDLQAVLSDLQAD